MNALHILSADIQDTIHFRLKEGSCIVVSNGFYLTLIQLKGRLKKSFTVTGGAGVSNFRIGGKLFLNLGYSTHGSLNGRTLISGIESIEQFSVFGD